MDQPVTAPVENNPCAGIAQSVKIIAGILIFFVILFIISAIYALFFTSQVNSSANGFATLVSSTSGTANNINSLVPLVQTTFTNINNAVPVITGTAVDINNIVDEIRRDIKELKADFATFQTELTPIITEIENDISTGSTVLPAALAILTNSAAVSQEYYCSISPGLRFCPGSTGTTLGNIATTGTTSLLGNAIISNGVLSTANGSFCVGNRNNLAINSTGCGSTSGFTGGITTEFVASGKSSKQKCRSCKKH